MIVHILAAFAEFEADQISRRTKDALRVTKNRGVELGKNGLVLSKENKTASLKFINKMKPVIKRLQKAGFKTVRQINDKLNRLKVRTSRNQKWHLSTVHEILKSL